METERMALSQRERDCIRVFAVKQGHLTQVEGERRLQRYERQVRRLLLRIAQRGDGALVHTEYGPSIASQVTPISIESPGVDASRQASLPAAFEPTQSDREQESDVITRIVVAKTGAGEMAQRAFKKQGAAALVKITAAHDELRGEVHLRGVTGRNIAFGENNPTGRRDVRSEFLAAREIPLPDDRFEAASVDGSAPRCEHGVKRHDVYRPFEISAQQAGQVVAGKNAAHSSARVEKLGTIGFTEARATASQDAKFPGPFYQGLRVKVLERSGGLLILLRRSLLRDCE
jgi:hypothetical protein